MAKATFSSTLSKLQSSLRECSTYHPKYGMLTNIAFRKGEGWVAYAGSELVKLDKDWVKNRVPNIFGKQKNESVGDFEVVYTNRDYKTVRRIFKNDPTGPAENAAVKARNFARKLEADDAKKKYGDIRGKVSVRPLEEGITDPDEIERILKEKLPEWHFKKGKPPYTAIVCYPPMNTGKSIKDHYSEISQYAFVSTVSSGTFTVTQLRDNISEGWEPTDDADDDLAVFKDEKLREARYEIGLEPHHPRIVSGYKGVESKPFRKSFKNQQQQQKWVEDNDAEVHQVEKDHSRIRESILDESNFCEVGTRVSHRKHGRGRVIKLLGSDGDDGVKIKLDSGGTVTVRYTDQNLPNPNGWRRIRESAESLISKIETVLGEDIGDESFLTDPNGSWRDDPEEAGRADRHSAELNNRYDILVAQDGNGNPLTGEDAVNWVRSESDFPVLYAVNGLVNDDGQVFISLNTEASPEKLKSILEENGITSDGASFELI